MHSHGNRRHTRSQVNNTGNKSRKIRRLHREIAGCKREAERKIEYLRQEQDLLSRQYEDLESAHRNLSNENAQLRDCVGRKDQGRRSDHNYNFFINEYVQSYARKTGLVFDNLSATTVRTVLERMLHDATQAQALHVRVPKLEKRLQTLQQEMLKKFEKTHVKSDDQFAQEFRSLASAIRSLSRTVRQTTGINGVQTFDKLVLFEKVSPHYWNKRATKKCLVEAGCWSILAVSVFNGPYSVFGLHYEALNVAWTQMYGDKHNHSWPVPSSNCESWRWKTAEQLIEQTGEKTFVIGEAGAITKNFNNSIMSAGRDIAASIETLLGEMSPEFESSLVHPIVDMAFTLAFQMSLQQSRLQVTYPSVGTLFKADQMSYVSNEDDEDDEKASREEVVAFVINPGLTKWGDAHGENLDKRLDIVPALVHLEPVGRIKYEPGILGQPENPGHPEAGSNVNFAYGANDQHIPDANQNPSSSQKPVVKQKAVVSEEPFVKKEPVTKQEAME